MASLQQHPAEVLFGAQNAHVMQRMREAQRAVDRLIADGFTVLAVKVRDRNPVIWIEGCARCAELRGVEVASRKGTSRAQIMAATVEGAQVQWWAA